MSEEQIQEVNDEEEVVEEYHYKYVVPVRFQNTNKSYSFGTDEPVYDTGDFVVVETVQGIELGECQAPALSTDIYPSRLPLRPILRKATTQDQQDFEENKEYAKRAKEVCQEEIDSLGLGMNLLSASYLLDRSKVLFIYTAEQRVDFRELLKRLGTRLHCRIELRQIGDRDQAKIVGGIGLCGMECCCSRFKNHFDNISINMAKTQQLALNIEKLSGMCGKLMCCLKYENEAYEELTEGLPKIGAHVEYEGELYRVSGINVISGEAHIENSETYQTITVDDLREKAEVRKGVSIKKNTEGTRKTVTRIIKTETKPEELATIKQETPRVEEKKVEERRPQNNNKKRPNNNRRDFKQNEKPTQSSGNVTVRSFKAKKKEG